MSKVESPWDERQVRKIREWQSSPWVHPFTCPNRSDPPHVQNVYDTDLGVLRVGEYGLWCPYCSYTQHWVHDFMADHDELKGPLGWQAPTTTA